MTDRFTRTRRTPVTIGRQNVSAVTSDTIAEEVESVAERYAHVTPFVRRVWLSNWAFAALLGAALVALPWAIGEGLYHRERLRRAAGRVRSRLSR